MWFLTSLPNFKVILGSPWLPLKKKAWFAFGCQANGAGGWKFVEACEDAASYYLAFELCTGGTLLEAIEDRFAADWEECVYAAWLIKDSIMRKVFGRTFKFIYPSPRVFAALKKENESWNMSSGYFTSTAMLVLGGLQFVPGCLDFFLDGSLQFPWLSTRRAPIAFIRS